MSGSGAWLDESMRDIIPRASCDVSLVVSRAYIGLQSLVRCDLLHNTPVCAVSQGGYGC